MGNDVSRAGQPAGPKELFGPFARFGVQAIHTRFGGVEWFVTDAANMDGDGLFRLPAVVGQYGSREAAVAALNNYYNDRE